MSAKRFLVTGANGYMGTHVIRELRGHGFEVVACDLRSDRLPADIPFLKADLFHPESDLYLDAGKPDAMIHLAWRNGFQHNADSHMQDLPGHLDFLRRMMDSGLRNISVMGTMHEIGYWEGPITAETPANPQSFYGIAKNALRQSALLLAKQKGADLHWLRAYYLYGDDELNNSIFSKLLAAAREGKETFPFNSGRNKYDFLSIHELAHQIAAAASQAEGTGIINCCSGQPVSLAEMVERFIRERNLSIRLDYGAFPDRPYDSPAVWGDNTEIVRLLAAYEGK